MNDSMKGHVMIMTIIALLSFVAGTLFAFNVNSLFLGKDNSQDSVWASISELQTKVATLEAGIEALKKRVGILENQTLPSVKIRIEAYPTTDFYVRSHGLSIDEPLPNDWWLIIGYEFEVTGSAFTYVTTIHLASGPHYVEYASSGYALDYDLAWHARIYVDEVLIAEGEVGRDQHLRATFDV